MRGIEAVSYSAGACRRRADVDVRRFV